MNLRRLLLPGSVLLALGTATLHAQSTPPTPFALTWDTTTRRSTYAGQAFSTATLPSGWYAYENDTRLTAISALAEAHKGTGNTVSTPTGVYFFGTASTGYSLGAYSGEAAKGTNLYFGVAFQNTTGRTLTSAQLSFTVADFSNGGKNDNVLGFYALVPSSTLYGDITWTTLSGLELKSSGTTSNVSIPLGATSWAPSSTLWIRWTDAVNSGQERAWAVDNLSLTAVPEPSTYALALGLGTLGLVWYRRRVRQ